MASQLVPFYFKENKERKILKEKHIGLEEKTRHDKPLSSE